MTFDVEVDVAGNGATSVGTNHRAACRARSRAEFASKLGAVAEESDESLFWLELIHDGRYLPKGIVMPLLREADELTAIFTSGRRSAQASLISDHFKPQSSNPKPQE